MVERLDMGKVIDIFLLDESLSHFMRIVSDSPTCDETKEDMFIEFVHTYLKTRGKGYCRQFMENYRCRQQIQRKEKALRAKLRTLALD